MRNLLTGAVLEGGEPFSYTAVFWFRPAMSSARSRDTPFAAPLLPAGRRIGAVKAATDALQGDTFARKVTVWWRKVTVSCPKVTVSGVSGPDSVTGVNTPSAGSVGRQTQGGRRPASAAPWPD